MSVGVLNSGLFRDMFGTAAMREVFSDRAFMARCVEVEAALAAAEAKVGVIPADAAKKIAAEAPSVALDWEKLKAETQIVGYPILPLVKQLSAALGDAGRYVHWGATTQDIMDSATVLQVRAGLDLVGAELDAVRAILADLARKHRDTPMAGRTHLQQALPVTFGYKVGVWLSMLDRHAERLA